MKGTLNAGVRKTSDEQDVVVCTLFFGPSCLQTGQVTQSSDHTNSVFGANLEKEYQTVHLNLVVNRSYDPSGLGTLFQWVIITTPHKVAMLQVLNAIITRFQPACSGGGHKN